MTQLPGPIRAALGLVATVVQDGQSLPDKVIELPVLAVSTALQLSLRAQQRYAALTARGDEVLLQLRGGPPDEPPAWATFDDPDDSADVAAGWVDNADDDADDDADDHAVHAGKPAAAAAQPAETISITTDEPVVVVKPVKTSVKDKAVKGRAVKDKPVRPARARRPSAFDAPEDPSPLQVEIPGSLSSDGRAAGGAPR